MQIAIIGSGNVGKALAGQLCNNWPWQAGFKLVGPTP